MSKTFQWILGIIAALLILGGAFSGGILVGWFLPHNSAEEAASEMPTGDVQADEIQTESLPTQSPAAAEISQDEKDTGFVEVFSVLEEAWQLVHELYVDQPVDDEVLMQGAIRGMMDALGDKHSSYLDPTDYQQLTITQDGTYEGIGAWVDTSGDYVTIISPMSGSPAEAAGLKPGDIIIAIDGLSMTDVDPAAALQNILGPAGTTVILTIQREDTIEPFDVPIERAEIVVPSVEYEMLDNRIAYLQLANYGENTGRDFELALVDLLDQDPAGLILDLRGNGGGYLYTAVSITSQFLEENQTILIEEYGDGTQETWSALPGGKAQDIPLVVLVDSTSASASEITAGAIQDLERGLLVGTTTYGKGSVQNIIPLSQEQGAVRITIAKWLTPLGRHIHGQGLTPDIIIEFDPEAYEADGTDNQLQKAIEVLLEQID